MFRRSSEQKGVAPLCSMEGKIKLNKNAVLERIQNTI
jgi:hypothetical protein